MTVTFRVELKHSFYSFRESVRIGPYWTPAQLSVSDDSLSVSQKGRTIELRARRVRWRSAESFSIAGLDNHSTLKTVIVRFETPQLASRAASLILEQNSVAEQKLPEPRREIEALVLNAARVGPYFLLVILSALLPLLASLYHRLEILRLAVSFLFISILYLSLARISDSRLLSGPAWSFLRKRPVRVWLSVDDELNIRTLDEHDAFRPSRIIWMGFLRFIVEGEHRRLDISFPEASNAVILARAVRERFPNLREN